MRVAILNREPSAYPGGDLIVIEELQKALTKLDIQTNYIYGHWTPQTLEPYDLVHIYHCNFTWSAHNFAQTIASNKPYVVTPVFYPTDELGMNYGDMKTALGNARCIMPFSVAEFNEICDRVGVFKSQAIPNGTSEAFNPEHAERNGVLAVSARGPSDKNCALVGRICQELELPFLLAACMPREHMPFIYKHAKVFVNASESERMSLTIGEALCAGCRVLATKYNRGNEWYPRLVTIDPSNREELSHAIHMAYFIGEWNYQPNEAARRITWEWVAERVKQVYEEALR